MTREYLTRNWDYWYGDSKQLAVKKDAAI